MYIFAVPVGESFLFFYYMNYVNGVLLFRWRLLFFCFQRKFIDDDLTSDGCPKTSQSGSGNMVCLPLQAADESAQDAAAWWNLPECTMDFVFSCVGVYESWMVGAPGVLCFGC